MSRIAQSGGVLLNQAFDDTNIRGSVTLTAGSAGVKGSWSEIISSAPFDACGVKIVYTQSSNVQQILDIGFGASSSEYVAIADFASSHGRSAENTVIDAYFPVRVKSGQRISARIASNSASSSGYVGLGLMRYRPGMHPGASKVIAIGAGTDRGTVIIPSATLNTWGSWIQLSSSLPSNVYGLLPYFGFNNSASKSSIAVRTAIGIGSSSNEVQICTYWNYLWANPDSMIMQAPNGGFAPISLRSGVRVAARAMADASVATQANRDFDLTLYGLVA